jgi:hypothetical protein
MRTFLSMILAACVLVMTVSPAEAARRGRGRGSVRVVRSVARAAFLPVRAARRVLIGRTGVVLNSGVAVLSGQQVLALRTLSIFQRRAILVQTFGPTVGAQLLLQCQ